MVTKASDPLAHARELSLAGLLGALALLLPIGFHMLGWLGRVFLPMHLPIVIASFLVSAPIAAGLGVVTPFLSAVLTGMPPLAPPVALLMSLELAAKATVISLLYRRCRLPLWLALGAGILADWVVLTIAVILAADYFAIQTSPLIYVSGVILISWPGSVLQVIGAPLVVKTIEQRAPRFAPERVRK